MMTSDRLTTLTLMTGLAGLVACQQGTMVPSVPAASQGAGIAGITWTAPVGWQMEGEKPMRVASYRVPAAPGDLEPGDCAVFFFGSGQGGDIEANLQRWYGQIEQPDGSASSSQAKKVVQSINGVQVTTIEVPGTYLFSPRPMSPDKVKKNGYLLIGAIVEAPGGNVFFKLTAPMQTARTARFVELLQSIHRV